MTTSFVLLSVTAALLLSQTVCYVAADLRIRLAPSDIAAICDKSIDRNFCLNFLKTTPGIPTADLKGAGLITLDAARGVAADTEKYINNLLGKTADPKTKESYKSCLSSYDDAVDNIETATASLNSGDYNGANIQASAAQTDADDCEDVKGSELPSRNQDFIKVLGIVLIIANKLLGR